MTDPYIDPGTGLLRNKFGITNADRLDQVERHHIRLRLKEGTPSGRFDLAHLRAIHGHLFQDLYDWAGQVRTVEIAKGGSQFQPVRFIEAGMTDIHSRLTKAEFLRSLPRDAFAARAAAIIGDVNHVHPFREGNGRTQLEYLRQLAYHAGHRFEQSRLDPERWISASRDANRGDYSGMADQIRLAIPDRTRSLEHIAAELERDRGGREL